MSPSPSPSLNPKKTLTKFLHISSSHVFLFLRHDAFIFKFLDMALFYIFIFLRHYIYIFLDIFIVLDMAPFLFFSGELVR